MNFKKTALLLAMMAATPFALADMFEPSHVCMKPFKPLTFGSQFDLDMFLNDVARYKRCISDFVEEQNGHAAKHQSAAEEAIEEWNRFVRFELGG